jgi:hypothetical protein
MIVQEGATKCLRCRELCTVVPIESATAMENLLKVVLDNVADGTIVEVDYWPDGQVRFSQRPFSTIRPTGPWPDVLLYYFSCPDCGQMFELSVESFHGFGGSWSPWPVASRDAGSPGEI